MRDRALRKMGVTAVRTRHSARSFVAAPKSVVVGFEAVSVRMDGAEPMSVRAFDRIGNVTPINVESASRIYHVEWWMLPLNG